MERSMRVLIADDQPKVRFALHILLDRQPGINVVGEAEDAQDLLRQAQKTDPDLLLLDWELPGLAKSGLLSALRRVYPNLSVIALSGRTEASHAALASGVNAFVSKVEPPENLLSAIYRYQELSLPHVSVAG
jgi:DNA-binding NarL/FixJ family response regulator